MSVSGKTSLECLTMCSLNINCSVLNIHKNKYNGELGAIVDCGLINIQRNGRLSLTRDSETSVLFEIYPDANLSSKVINGSSSSFVVRENVSIPRGQTPKYCFLFCN